jgi:O-antigen ligase
MPNRVKVNLFCFGLAFVAIIITPWVSYDPLNLPKQLVLVIFAGILISTLSKSEIRQILSQNKTLNIVTVLFILQLILVLSFAPGNFYQQLYGASGRQTGFLTYFALIIFMITAIHLCSYYLIKSTILTLIIVGVLSIGYGLLQSFNLDPINWTTPHSPIFGFLGNPNFYSSFIGFSIAPALAYILKVKFLSLRSWVCLVYVFLSLYLIYRTDSKQGFLVTGVVATTITILYVFKESRLNILKFFAAISAALVLVASILDILQKSPWDSILYEASISFRGDFWRAAIKMGLDHPFFGVGMDSYRDYYFRSRDLVASQRSIAESSVDSAHNVILDMLSNGGLPLAFIYILILVLTFVSAFRILKKMVGFDPLFVSVFAVWIGFQAQSLISINAIGLSVWGWVFGGLILGYDTLTNNNKSITNTQQKGKVKTDSFKILPALIGFILGIIIVFPVFKADMNFRTAIDSRSIDLISASAYIYPQSIVRMNYVARTFQLNELNDISLDIARDAVIFSPETFESWKLIYELPNSSTSEKEEAYRRIAYLNPAYFTGK